MEWETPEETRKELEMAERREHAPIGDPREANGEHGEEHTFEMESPEPVMSKASWYISMMAASPKLASSACITLRNSPKSSPPSWLMSNLITFMRKCAKL